jgi:hypothetical protein
MVSSLKKKCPTCQKRRANYSKEYGYIACNYCLRLKNIPKRQAEITTDKIRNQRREYKKDIIQPYRDGVISKEYIETYGTAGIKATDKEIRNAQYTMKDTAGWWNRDKSKGGR